MISFLGDVYLDKQYRSLINLENFIFNLEYPISSRGIPAKNKINLIQQKSHIVATFGKKPLAVCLANNHIMDFGEEAFEDTIKYLEEENIRFFGAGNKKNNFNNPLLINIAGKIVAISGYSCRSTNAGFGSDLGNGSALLEYSRIKEDLDNFQADYKIVQLHWGMEEIAFPTYNDVQLAHKIIDGGADVIIGHHAHVIQPVEEYNGKMIFYGLGNCIFPDFALASHFDGTSFTKFSSKKQRNHNKRSLLVSLNSMFAVTYEKLFFDGTTLMNKNFSIPDFIPISKKDFDNKYNRYQRFDMLRRFFLLPRIPNISQIKKMFCLEKVS